MADDAADKRQRGKKKKSSLLLWKKKFNIRKRFSNKLPLHRRHMRSLMSGWSLNEIKSVLMQYEITSMLRELSLWADKTRPSASTLNEDLLTMYRTSSCCDMMITCCEMTESRCMLAHDSDASHKKFKVHGVLVASRWPYLNGVISEKISNFGGVPCQGNHLPPNSTYGEIPYDLKSNLNFATWNIHINGLSENKLNSILSEIYHGTVHLTQQPSPRKLLPLPTTDDSLHIRNSRGNKQHFRYTTYEYEQPAVPRRRSRARRKHKHRFSMDERILSKQHSPPSYRAHRVSPSKSNDFVLNSGLSCQDEFRHLSFENPYLKPYGKTSIPNFLADDMLKMYHDTKSGIGDLKLIVGSEPLQWNCQNLRKEETFYCHKFVLAARSPYFKRLINNQHVSYTNSDGPTFIQTLEIDGNIIPAKWMSAVLYTMYTDKIHFLDLTERVVQGIAMNNPLFHIEDAITLHQIGNFIEFSMLIHGCEELIVNHLDERNFYHVLQWSSLPHGSDWVRRQVNIFIRDRFTELLGSEALFKLNASQIVEVLQSDFVNASELEILKCALKWGEQELCRRIELTEPNLLTHTAHSISRNKTDSARRREVLYSRIDELHECTAPVLACVRTQHLLPPNHEVYVNAVKRGVISRLPTDLLESVTDKETGSRQWVKSRADFVPPRLFQPYMDETRNILDETYAQESDCVNLRSMHSLPQDSTWGSMRHPSSKMSTLGIPDTLYMVGQSRVPTRRRYGNRDLHLNFMQQRTEAQKQKTELTKFMGNFHPVPDISIVRDLIGREREVRASHLVSRILSWCVDCCHSNSSGFTVVSYAGRLSIPQTDASHSHEDSDETEHCNRCTALRLVRLHVVREQGLPDCAVDLLQHPEMYYTLSELRGVTVTDTTRTDFERKDGVLSAVLDSANVERRYSSAARLSRERSKANRKTRDNHNSSYVGDSVQRWCETTESTPSNACNSFYVNRTTSGMSDTSTSSDEDTTMFSSNQKKNSASKRSSSTTSFQSIPDVAASANSSLQRLRDNSQKTTLEFQDTAVLLSQMETQPLLRQGHFGSHYDSSSSSDENVTETISGLHANLDFPANSDIPWSRIPVESTYEVGTDFIKKAHSSRRPVSTDMSELFSKALDFADDTSDSVDETLIELLHPTKQSSYRRTDESFVADVPEIVRDGTPPCNHVASTHFKRPSLYRKPDIYPTSSELWDSSNIECGQYFLRSRDNSVNTDDCEPVRLLSVGIPPLSNSSHRDTESDSVDNDTIFL